MSLQKSTSQSNLASIHKVEIMKDIFITDIPDATSFNLSEMSFANEQQFHEIEITDGTYSVKTQDEGHGGYKKIQANFRHPKVRSEAEEFLKPYEGNKVRLVITDKNGICRLTPAGKISISENVPDLPNYNGYGIQFTGVGESVPFIIMDAYPEPPQSIWDQIYYAGANGIALVNQAFTLELYYFNWFGGDNLLMLNFDGNKEIIPFAAMEKKSITRQYAASEGSYIKITGAIDNGDGTYSQTVFPTQTHGEKLIMKNAGATRWHSVDNPYQLDLSGNSIIKEDLNTLLEKYNLILTQPQYWDVDNYFYIDGQSPFGYNGIPDSAEAIAVKNQMLALQADSYRDNS